MRLPRCDNEFEPQAGWKASKSPHRKELRQTGPKSESQTAAEIFELLGI
jgi:hypothetical protein